jgi:hypothetical protein
LRGSLNDSDVQRSQSIGEIKGKHPKFIEEIEGPSFMRSFFFTGCIFALTEGVGMVIYFAVSAALDNFTVFFVRFKTIHFCKPTTAISLYTMALITFLPNVMISKRLQPKMWEGKNLLSKATFTVLLAVITMCFFVIRLELVYKFRPFPARYSWAEFVDSWFGGDEIEDGVVLACIVPPIVDAIQSIMLIRAGALDKHLEAAKARERLTDSLRAECEGPSPYSEALLAE